MPSPGPAPFRADHVGSLLRPAALSALRARHRAGEVDAAALAAAEDEAIADVVHRQHGVGLQSITDGELRRDWWHLDFLGQLDGVTLAVNEGPKFKVAGQGEQPPIATVTGRVGCSRPVMADHFAYLRTLTDCLPGAVAKMTIPSPSMLHLRGGRAAISRAVYPDLEAFWRRPAAATCSSTTWPSPTSATRRCRPPAAPTAMTRLSCRAPTRVSSTPRWPAATRTCA